MNYQQSGVPQVFLFLYSLLFILLALIVTFPSMKVVWQSYESQQWPEVTGRVVSSVIERRDPSRGDVSGQGYRLKLRYSYLANGQERLSDRLFMARNYHSSRAVVEAQLKQFVPGTQIRIQYDPKDPAVCLVENDATPWMDVVLAGIGVLVIFGAVTNLSTVLFKRRSS